MENSEIRGKPQPQRLRMMSVIPTHPVHFLWAFRVDGDDLHPAHTRGFRSLLANRLCLRAEAILVALMAAVS